ncbi:4-coumarate--CoA ligase-like 9 [Linum perenne]
MKSMLQSIETHRVNNIPAVPPVILGIRGPIRVRPKLAKASRDGAAALSGELGEEFRRKFPWVELRPAYGLTESWEQRQCLHRMKR